MFAKETRKVIESGVVAEYENACKNWGEYYQSIFEAYCVLREEVQEMNESFKKCNCKKMMKKIFKSEIRKNNSFLFCEKTMNKIKHHIAECFQVLAVMEKINNTFNTKGE